MCNLINIHTYIHTYIHRMARMTGPDCAVLCNLLNKQRERERERVPFVASDQKVS